MLVNNTQKSLNTKVSLYLTLDGQNAEELFKLGNGLQEITLAPKNVRSFLPYANSGLHRNNKRGN